MRVFVCENPECRNFRRGATDGMCERCGHKFVGECRKCGRPITSTTSRHCWACGARYKLEAPLPDEVLARRWEADQERSSPDSAPIEPSDSVR